MEPKQKPDIIAVNSMTLFWIGSICQQMRIPVVCFHRETYKKGLIGVRSSIVKHALKTKFDGVACISNFDRKQTGNSHNTSLRITDKVDLSLYELVDKAQVREKLMLPQNKKLVLFTGGCSRLKGGLIAVKALEYISDKDVALVFLQYEPDSTKMGFKNQAKERIKVLLRKNYKRLIENEIESNNLKEKVYFRPSTMKVNEYFLACDMVVFPSEIPHQARPIYEAGAARIPIVISDYVNTEEFVTEKNGYLFKPHSAKSLASRIVECFTNQQVMDKKVSLNYQMTKKNHDLNNLRGEVVNLLNAVMDKYEK